MAIKYAQASNKGLYCDQKLRYNNIKYCLYNIFGEISTSILFSIIIKYEGDSIEYLPETIKLRQIELKNEEKLKQIKDEEKKRLCEQIDNENPNNKPTTCLYIKICLERH